MFDFWAMPHQRPPEGDWRTWVILGGRGAGKTRAGSEWIRSIAEGATPLSPGRCARIALIGETMDQARDVMVFGESGILATSPKDARPDWKAQRKLLEWPNGATAQVFSAFDPERLRGPQFDAAWADELAKWPKAVETWDMLQFGLRLGDDPRCCVTTTPRNHPLLKDLLSRESTVKTHATTQANRANLAEGFMQEIEARYAGTRLGRQELEGELLTEAEDGLWMMSAVARRCVDAAPDLDRIVVAVDPPVSGHATSDECGIIVAGVSMKGPQSDWCAYVLEDATIAAAKPLDWATRAVEMLHKYEADRLVAEVNQGGDMVGTILKGLDPSLPYTPVRATRGKVARAEPVAAQYQQGRVRHLRGLGQLEAQMGLMTTKGYTGHGSPDRVDALVWAIFSLLIAQGQGGDSPRMRHL